MKKFNQVITVEVSVDNIAQQLLKTINPEFQHAEMLAETIIGTSLDKGTIGFLYNSLNGYTNDIDFKVGDVITCTEQTYGYVPDTDAENNTTYSEKRMSIGDCTVVEINVYKSDKLLVEFSKLNSKGEFITKQNWVNHKNCSGINNMV